MEKSARKLIGISSILHKCIFRTSYARDAQNAPTYAHYSQADTSTLEQEQRVSNDNSRLYMKSHESNGGPIISLTKVIPPGSKTFNIQFSLQKLKTLTFRQKGKETNINALIEDEQFLEICRTLSYRIRSMSLKETVFALKCMDALGVPTSTTIVQKILQMIRVQVNDLTLTHISYLRNSLARRKKTPLVVALMSALAPAFVAQIHTIDKSNTQQLIQILYTACQLKDEKHIETISAQLLQHNISTEKMERLLAVYKCLYWRTTQPPSSKWFMSRIESCLMERLNTFSYTQMWALLDLICMHTKKKTLWTQENIQKIDLLFDHILKHTPNQEDIFKLVLFSNAIVYSNVPLLDYLAAKVEEDDSIIRTCPTTMLNNLLTCINIAHHESSISQLIKKEVTKRVFNKSNLIVDLAYNLSGVDHFDPHILEQAFTLRSKRVDRRHSLLSLYQCVKAFYPEYTGPLPSLIELLNSKNASSEDTGTFLLKGLNMALKGHHYTKSKLRSKLGHIVDHVVAMQPDNKPVDMRTICDENTIFVENIRPPSGCQLILIFDLPPQAYPINSQRAKRTWLKGLKAAEVCTGHRAVAINVDHIMNSYPDYEQIPYLRESIKYRENNPSVVDLVP